MLADLSECSSQTFLQNCLTPDCEYHASLTQQGSRSIAACQETCHALLRHKQPVRQPTSQFLHCIDTMCFQVKSHLEYFSVWHAGCTDHTAPTRRAVATPLLL